MNSKIIFMSVVFVTGSTAFAATTPTKAEREEMAKSHDEMASCLRTDRTMADCHKIMRDHHAKHSESCAAMSGDGQCSADEHGGVMHGKGIMHGKDKMTKPTIAPTKAAQ